MVGWQAGWLAVTCVGDAVGDEVEGREGHVLGHERGEGRRARVAHPVEAHLQRAQPVVALEGRGDRRRA